MTELKPCPFCGGEADFIGDTVTIKCKDCACTFLVTSPLISRLEVAEAWNRRVDDDEKQIPKKPAEQGDGINYDCPVCGADVGYFDAMAWETPKYCPECGQALDWERKEEG